MKSRIHTAASAILLDRGAKPSLQAEGRRRPGRFVSRLAKDPSRSFSLLDLEIPSEPLLNAEEERNLGNAIKSSFRNLTRALPTTIGAYRLFTQRMEGAILREFVPTLWFPLMGRIEKDLEEVLRHLETAEGLAADSPQLAERALLQGVKVLELYPLDLETKFQWGRSVVSAGASVVTAGGAAAGASLSAGVEPLAGRPRAREALETVREAVRIIASSRDHLVLPNLRLVLKEVFRYRPIGMKHSDLFQEGILGLHRAIFRYDPARLTRFSTYATYWIRQAIRKALIDRSRLIRVPQAVQEELRNPKTHISEGEKNRVRQIMKDAVSISAGDDDSASDHLVPDMLADHGAWANERLHTGTIPREVSRALVVLDPREREVIRRRFGLSGERTQTLEEIGDVLHLSRERIRQIETEALRKMSRVESLQEVYDDLEEEDLGDGDPRRPK